MGLFDVEFRLLIHYDVHSVKYISLICEYNIRYRGSDAVVLQVHLC